MIVLLPDSSSKIISKWLGPGVVLQKRKTRSYLLEPERGQNRWLHASKLRRYHVRVNQALVNNCSIIYEADEEFGTISVVTTETQLDVDFPSARVYFAKLAHLSTEQRSFDRVDHNLLVRKGVPRCLIKILV